MPKIDMTQFLKDTKVFRQLLIEDNASNQLINDCEEMIQDALAPLTLMVMGEFSTGKSTFINALLGQEVAAVNDTPTTAVITKICYGDEDELYLHYKDGRIEKSDIRNFKEISSESGSGARKIHKFLAYIERHVPIDILRNLIIIDSPGLNSAISEHTQATNSFINKADVVFWVMSAYQPDTESASEAMGRLDFRLRPVVIMNKMDSIDPEEDDPEEFLEEQKEKLNGKIEEMLGLSARDAFDGIIENDPIKVSESGLDAVHQLLQKKVLPNQWKYKKDTLLDELSDVAYILYTEQKRFFSYLEDMKDENFSYYMERKNRIIAVQNQFLSMIEPFYKSISLKRSNSTEKIFKALLYGCGYLKEHDIDYAISLLEKAAKTGNLRAQFYLGIILYKEKDDYEKAFSWLENAASKGHSDSQVLLGLLRIDRKIIDEKTIDWIKKSAKQGNEDAQGILGMCYIRGIGVESDFDEAINWLKKGIRQGSMIAQRVLGECYYLGIGVLQNYKEAVKCKR